MHRQNLGKQIKARDGSQLKILFKLNHKMKGFTHLIDHSKT